MSDFVIRTDNLTRRFDQVTALDGISLQVPSGIVFGFLGPNGSGKTTTIRVLLGLMEPTAGTAQVLGYDVRSQGAEVRQNCGALLEHSGLYERLSAEDNLEFYGQVWHLRTTERRARIRELLDAMGLWERRKETTAHWSRGMKQKLAIARALLHRPRLVFLDEPTAGLDPVAATALRADLEKLTRDQGVTIFLTSHNLSEIEKMCAQVAVIRQGRLLMSGSPDELRLKNGGNHLEIIGRNFTPAVMALLEGKKEVEKISRQDHHVDIELANGADGASLLAELIQHGVLIDQVQQGKANLEEVFLSLMTEEQQQVVAG